MDSAGNPGHVAAGELIESVWGNAVADRVIRVFATTAERDAQWINPPNGAVSEAPVGTMWNRVAGVWVRTPGSRIISGTSSATPLSLTAVGMYDMQTVALGNAPVACLVVANLVVYAGLTTVDTNVGVDILRLDTGAVVAGSPRPVHVFGNGNGMYPVPLTIGWNVAAGAAMSFKVRFEITGVAGGGGTLSVTNTVVYSVEST